MIEKIRDKIEEEYGEYPAYQWCHIDVLKIFPECYRLFSDKIRLDRELGTLALNLLCSNFEYCSKELQNDPKLKQMYDDYMDKYDDLPF